MGFGPSRGADVLHPKPKLFSQLAQLGLHVHQQICAN
jgi:hypothetical protein